MIASSEGSRAWLPTGFTVVRIEALTRTDGVAVRNGRGWVFRDADMLTDEAVRTMAAEAAATARWLANLDHAVAPSEYLGPVLFETAAATELFRQLVAPEIAGTPPLQVDPNSYEVDSRPTARIGRRLLPSGWSIVDDPTTPGQAASYSHDFEGVPAMPVEVVIDGVVRDVLMSRVPRKTITASTGHGRSLGSGRREALPAVVSVTPPREFSQRKLRKKALRLARQAGLDHVLVVRRLEPPAVTEQFQMAMTGEGPLAGLTPPYEAVISLRRRPRSPSAKSWLCRC